MTAARLIVVTVTLNDLTGLRATYDSLRSQTRQDTDWVVIDGGSQDGTVDWLRRHEQAVLWWRSEPDHGIYDGMNRALSSLEGQLRHRPDDGVMFLNAGDTLAIDNIAETLITRLNASSAALIYGDAIEGDIARKAALKRARSHHLAILGMFTHHQSMVYRAGVIAGLRFNLEYLIGADYDLTIKVLRQSTRVERLHLPLCAFRGGGVSCRNAGQGRRDQSRIRKSHYPIATLSNNIISIIQWASLTIKTLFPGIYANLRYRNFYR